MVVVYNYFEQILIPGPENPLPIQFTICKTCSKLKRIVRGKTSIV